MIFQPMLEMLDYLRSQDFKTYIVSGSDTGFIRAFAEKRHSAPVWVIGFLFVTSFPNAKDGKASIVRTQNWRPNGGQTRRDAVIGSDRFSSGSSTATCKCCSGRPPAQPKRFVRFWCTTDAKREWALRPQIRHRQARQKLSMKQIPRLDK